MKKQILVTVFILITAMLYTSCSDTPVSNNIDTGTADEVKTTTTAEEETELYKDDVPKLSFNGDTFDIYTREAGHMNYKLNVEEQNAEPVNDAIYNRNRTIEERFDITITEIYSTAPEDAYNAVLAGDDSYEMVKTRGPMAMTFIQTSLAQEIDEIPYIDLTKPYWDRTMNASLTIAGRQYIVSGALSLTEYDYTSALLFNKQMITDFSFDSPYDLVNTGVWTFDKMGEMMTVVIYDTDGNGKMNANDRYGYLASAKHVLPSFIIAANEKTISKDADDLQVLSMDTERFYNVLMKAFQITRDTGSWYPDTGGDNVNQSAINMFSNNQSLFMDTVLFYINQLRNMETDFGIIPYPKYDLEQSDYVTRCAWIEPFIIPVTNNKQEMSGAIIESLCCESAKTVIPAYYDITLKNKISRDEDSSAMLDLILSRRVIDFGDTVWVDIARDGVLVNMFQNDNRDLTSRVKTMEKQVNARIKKLSEAFSN